MAETGNSKNGSPVLQLPVTEGIMSEEGGGYSWSRKTANSPDGMEQAATGKIIMITGAGRGIGQAIAKAFAQASAKALILTALEKSELQETEKSIRSINSDCGVFSRALDVRDRAGVEDFVKDAASWANGQIDVLCANAGIAPPVESIATSDPDAWWSGLEINLKGPYLFSRYVLPKMQRKQSGCIIFTSSIAAHLVEIDISSYLISKLALTRLADCIDVENRKMGITTFAIHPGRIATQLLENIEGPAQDPESQSPGGFPSLDDASLPGPACVFLASGQADFLSGRFVDITTGLANICKEKDVILENDLLRVGVSARWTQENGKELYSRTLR
ncbi:hypothetical protein BJY01DRAFT_246106 [Aspergillus pseudoustus]|uniref:NAD(P)-binding protein n=1 Tax=Aspergillus pseudoustus TaxID=1810923 RepID=A0ABR4K9B7_9EURO